MHEQALTAARRWDWDAPISIPTNLPLLDALRSGPLESQGLRFSNWDMVLIQHHLGSFLPLVNSFLDDGMLVDRSWLIDIPYSTNQKVNDILRRRWTNAGHLPPVFDDPFADYAQIQMLRVAFVLRHALQREQPRPLLVIDTGAHFLRAILNLERAGLLPAGSLAPRVALVEQTTRGHRFLRDHHGDLLRLGIPAVTVARALTKVELEAPCIGESIVQKISRQIVAADRVAVIGFGVIGEAVSHALSIRLPHAALSIFENRQAARRRAEGESRGRWHVMGHGTQSGSFDVVVGCTGTRAVNVEDCGFFADRSILVSGSSAAVEFDKTGLIEQVKSLADEGAEIVDMEDTYRGGLHAPINFRLPSGRLLTLLNGGFPANHTGAICSLPSHMIQPTRCLVFAAAVQAQRASPGLSSLDSDIDRWIFDQALMYLE